MLRDDAKQVGALKAEIKEKDETINQLAEIHEKMKTTKTKKIKELTKRLNLIEGQNHDFQRGNNGSTAGYGNGSIPGSAAPSTPMLQSPAPIKAKVRSRSNIPARTRKDSGNYNTVGNRSGQTSRVSNDYGRADNYSTLSLPALNRGSSYQNITAIDDHLMKLEKSVNAKRNNNHARYQLRYNSHVGEVQSNQYNDFTPGVAGEYTDRIPLKNRSKKKYYL